MTERLLTRLKPDMLLLADRGFFSFALWRKAAATGADLLWRIRTDAQGPRAQHVQDLPDGSWLAHLKKSTDRTSTPPMLVRVVDYTVDDGRTNPETCRLFSTLLDPNEASAVALAAACARHLDYPKALASGAPIATGVIEGACRHLVQDPTDITGVRWDYPEPKLS